jgi:hypothetical protein
MNNRFLPWLIGAWVVGLSTGICLTASDESFVLEANNTPFGSYVFRYNPSQDTLLPPALDQNEQKDLIA